MHDTYFWGFIAAAIVVLLVPGPGVVYVVARSATQGYRAGIVSVLGLSTGALLHVVAATIGLSAILLASATAFTVIKFLGAGYLVYLGIRMLLSRESVQLPDTSSRKAMYRLFTDGVIISAFNPKIAIFFLAFLPQFVRPGTDDVSRQILLLGLTYVGLAILTDGCYSLLAGKLRTWFLQQKLRRNLTRYLGGGVYIGLGVSTALTGNRN